MRPFRKFILEFLSYSRGEQRGILAWVSLIIILWIILNLIEPVSPLGPVVSKGRTEHTYNIHERPKEQVKKEQSVHPVVREFPFDPNHISADSLRMLGLRERQVKNWIAFRRAGGRFYKREDIRRLYALDKEQCRRLEPWVRLPEHHNVASGAKENVPAPVVKATMKVLDINRANEEEWRQLKGIGAVFARRIVRYRNLLGGFSDVKQLEEVYGLDSAKLAAFLPALRLLPDSVRKIDLNQSSFSEMLRHPYLPPDLVKAIFRSRKEQPFGSVEELHTRGLVAPELYGKIAPYLKVTYGKGDQAIHPGRQGFPAAGDSL